MSISDFTPALMIFGFVSMVAIVAVTALGLKGNKASAKIDLIHETESERTILRGQAEVGEQEQLASRRELPPLQRSDDMAAWRESLRTEPPPLSAPGGGQLPPSRNINPERRPRSRR